MRTNRWERCILGREQNILRVNFNPEDHPPEPKFPGGAALRAHADELPPPLAFEPHRLLRAK